MKSNVSCQLVQASALSVQLTNKAVEDIKAHTSAFLSLRTVDAGEELIYKLEDAISAISLELHIMRAIQQDHGGGLECTEQS